MQSNIQFPRLKKNKKALEMKVLVIMLLTIIFIIVAISLIYLFGRGSEGILGKLFKFIIPFD